ncbi:carboxypeptidase-like regulatory domain-containing protein, partial [Bacteroidota bacterium]
MKHFTKVMLLLMIFSLTAAIGFAQVKSPPAGISQEEFAGWNQKRQIDPDAQSAATVPLERLHAKKGISFTVPSNGSRSGNIHLELTVDNWWGEASYNLWDVTAGAYYWATDKTFTSAFQVQVWDLPLVDGNSYEVDCWDSFGDGGIAGDISNTDTGWPITSWNSTAYAFAGSFPFVANDGIAPPMVNTFPYLEDFNDGLAQDMTLVSQTAGFASVNTWAANASAFGLGLEGGNTSVGYATPSTGEQAFDAGHITHQPRTEIIVQPDVGNLGALAMKFDLRQDYTFNVNYSWFRVEINGVPIADIDGNVYFQPVVRNGDPFVERTFNLFPYQGSQFTITLKASNKYARHQYLPPSIYQEGDVACIDNFQLYYNPPTNVEGYVFNGGGLTIAGATVSIDGINSTTSGPDGYYMLNPVLAGSWDLQGSKAGYNTVTYPIVVTNGNTTYQDIILTAPTFLISPTAHDRFMHPNQFTSTPTTGILNTGDGPVDWTALVEYPVTDVVNIDPSTL